MTTPSPSLTRDEQPQWRGHDFEPYNDNPQTTLCMRCNWLKIAHGPKPVSQEEDIKRQLRSRLNNSLSSCRLLDELIAAVEKRAREKYGRCTHGILLEVTCRRCAEGTL